MPGPFRSLRALWHPALRIAAAVVHQSVAIDDVIQLCEAFVCHIIVRLGIWPRDFGLCIGHNRSCTFIFMGLRFRVNVQLQCSSCRASFSNFIRVSASNLFSGERPSGFASSLEHSDLTDSIISRHSFLSVSGSLGGSCLSPILSSSSSDFAASSSFFTCSGLLADVEEPACVDDSPGKRRV